jgi:hypothetical protein
MKYLIVLFTLVLAASPLHADPVTGTVAKFLGSWVGEGKVRAKGFGAEEVIRCEADGEQMNDAQISFAGRCATTGGSGAFRIFLAQDADGKVFVAKIKLSGSERMVDFAGKGIGDNIVLKQKKPLMRGEREVLSEITLALPETGEIILTDMLTDLENDEQTDALSLTFRKQP